MWVFRNIWFTVRPTQLARLLGLVANLVSYRLKLSKIGGESLSKPPRLRSLIHCSTELNTNLKPAKIGGDISPEFVAGYSWL